MKRLIKKYIIYLPTLIIFIAVMYVAFFYKKPATYKINSIFKELNIIPLDKMKVEVKVYRGKVAVSNKKEEIMVLPGEISTVYFKYPIIKRKMKEKEVIEGMFKSIRLEKLKGISLNKISDTGTIREKKKEVVFSNKMRTPEYIINEAEYKFNIRRYKEVEELIPENLSVNKKYNCLFTFKRLEKLFPSIKVKTKIIKEEHLDKDIKKIWVQLNIEPSQRFYNLERFFRVKLETAVYFRKIDENWEPYMVEVDDRYIKIAKLTKKYADYYLGEYLKNIRHRK